MLKANFNIAETGGTGEVKLQGSIDSGVTWIDIASALMLVDNALTISDSDNINIDTTIFPPGYSHLFRLIDTSGTPIGNIIDYRIPAIQDYVSGTGMIGFASTGGDNWSATFYFTPVSLQSHSGLTVLDCAATISFYSSGSETVILNGDFTADHTELFAGMGAGVYILECEYSLSDGSSSFRMHRLVKVDGAGNIIADIQINGSTASGVSGLDMTQTANVVQTGVSYTYEWYAVEPSAFTLLGAGSPVTFTLPTDTQQVVIVLAFDPVFTDDYPGPSGFFHATVTIS